MLSLLFFNILAFAVFAVLAVFAQIVLLTYSCYWQDIITCLFKDFSLKLC